MRRRTILLAALLGFTFTACDKKEEGGDPAKKDDPAKKEKKDGRFGAKPTNFHMVRLDLGRNQYTIVRQRV